MMRPAVYQPGPCPAGRHGTVSAYRSGCRCPQAREAKRLYDKRLRQGRPEVRRVDATGTVRRIHALMRLGHTAEVIGQAAERSARHVVTVARARKWITPENADAYRRAYDTLSMTLGTSRSTAARARAWGWPSPLAWDDETIDDPAATPYRAKSRQTDFGPDHAAVALALAGQPDVLVTRIDRHTAITALFAAGESNEVIAARLRMDVRAVARARQRQTVGQGERAA